MRDLPLPRTGPIHVDCTAQSVMGALRKLDETVRRMRPGPRRLVIRVGAEEVLEAATRWARTGAARHEVRRSVAGVEVHVYLLPPSFDGHPAVAFARVALARALASRAAGSDEAAGSPSESLELAG